MGLYCNMGTKPENLRVKTTGKDYPIQIGEYEISWEDFGEIVKYVLTNTALEPDDPRIKLVDEIKRMEIREGTSPFIGQQRFEITSTKENRPLVVAKGSVVEDEVELWLENGFYVWYVYDSLVYEKWLTADFPPAKTKEEALEWIKRKFPQYVDVSLSKRK